MRAILRERRPDIPQSSRQHVLTVARSNWPYDQFTIYLIDISYSLARVVAFRQTVYWQPETKSLRNRDLEMLVAKMLEGKNRGERISAAQLDLFLDKLRERATRLVPRSFLAACSGP